MFNQEINLTRKIELASYLWHELLTANKISKSGTVVEVAPGYEPKFGNALSMYGFKGTIFVVEPDPKAADCIKTTYHRLLPRATIRVIIRPLQKVNTSADIPRKIDAVVASHPFDDMVIDFILNKFDFFSQEKNSDKSSSLAIKKLYSGIKDRDYEYGVKTTAATWRRFIEDSKPKYFIASQYPSRTLLVKGLIKRQESGFAVLNQLKSFYRNSLIKQPFGRSFGYKGDSKWWIIAKKLIKI